VDEVAGIPGRRGYCLG